MHTHSPDKPKTFKQTLPAFQKADGNCFLGQEISADGGIDATRNYSDVRDILRDTKKLRRAIQNKMRAMLMSGVVLLHDNARQHTAVRTRALLEHFSWELFDSPDIALTDYHRYLRKELVRITAVQQ
jgi:hypothetical protein